MKCDNAITKLKRYWFFKQTVFNEHYKTNVASHYMWKRTKTDNMYHTTRNKELLLKKQPQQPQQPRKWKETHTVTYQ